MAMRRVCCSGLQCVAVCCSVLQCVAVCYSVLRSGDIEWQCVAMTFAPVTNISQKSALQ